METRRCKWCKVYLPLTTEHYQPRKKLRKSGEIIHTFEYACRVCTNRKARERGNPSHKPTGGKSGVRKDIKHTGPKPGTIEHKFFCT